MVRLRVKVSTEALDDIEFQFLHGAIKGTQPQYKVREIANFNSYMVRLRAFADSLIAFGKSHFNSYMVRLRVRRGA